MKQITLLLIFLFSTISYSQDINMQNGTFNQCSGTFYDSGGPSASYGSNENFVITICSDIAGNSVQLDFTTFSTQPGSDVLNIYDGDNLSAPLLGSFSGTTSPGLIAASSSNTSGCLTVEFTTNVSGNTIGWVAEISCFLPCQDIDATIDSTNPAPISGVIVVEPNDVISFDGSATFDPGGGTGATYTWDFGDGNTSNGNSVNHSYTSSGMYTVTFTVTDTNPTGCSDSETVTVEVRDNDGCIGSLPICSGIDNVPAPTGTGTAEPGIDYGCLGSQPRPRWYFLQTENTVGDLNFTLTQTTGPNGTGTGIDVDFIIWGPFTNPECGAANLNASTQVDCSFSPNAIEQINIVNAPANSYYTLLVTNFAGNPGFINLDLNSNSTSDTNCDIICQVDLGADVTSCNGQDYEIAPSFNGAFNTFEWYKDGVLMPSETGSTLTVAASGTYRLVADGVDAVFGEPCSSEDEIVVAIVDAFTTNDLPIIECSPTGTSAIIDLNALIPDILFPFNPLDYMVTFHDSTSDANNDIDAISSPNTYNGSDGEVIVVRTEANGTDCYELSSITLDISMQPEAFPYTYELCDDALDGDDNNGLIEFDLPSVDNQILGTQDPAQFTVTYHFDQSTADSGISPLADLYTNAIANTDQIIVRVENNDNPDCYETATVDLVVNALPIIISPVELIQCDDDTDGFSDFNLTEANTLISSNVANETFTYYNNFFDADNETANAITNITAYTNTDPSSAPDILYVRVENTSSGCHRVAQLDLLVEATQIPASVIIPIGACDTGTVDGDITNGVTTFNLIGAEGQIRALSGLPTGQNLTFTFYETEADALAEENEIPDLANHRNTASPFVQDIYVRVDGDLDNACVGLGVHVRLSVTNPTPRLDPPPLDECDDNMIGDLVETFNLRQNETYILNGDPDVVATYHLSYQAANDGVDAILNPITYENTNPTETIYVRVTNTVNTCYAIVSFDIIVNPLPEASVAITDFFECENNTDFRFDFDLESKTDEILNGQNPVDFIVTYHLTQADADNLASPLPNPYPSISNPQQIFVAITNTTTGCSISTLSFNIEVNEGAEADEDGGLVPYEICDEVGDNDGSAQFDLSTQNTEILGFQSPADFTLTYHETFDDAFNNVSPLPTLYENRSNPQTIYARVSNNIRPNDCFDITNLTLQVNLLPIFDLEDNYILCLSSNATSVIDIPPSIDTGLSPADYSFQWSLDGTPLPTETGASITPDQAGIYSVLVTDTSTSTVTSCQNSDSTEVIESELPSLTLELTSQTFSGNNVIEATATGIGNYEYSLDDGPWQDEGIFEDVSGGDHVVTARDKNGCGLVSDTILVIDYPLYFTPNGDGANDKWHITGIDTQPDAVIYIFDRYGKLLKQLSPVSDGWDGTFNGNDMPSSDYWFSLVYDEELTGQRKEFKSHFTLKR